MTGKSHTLVTVAAYLGRMVTLEQISAFARTTALNDRRSGRRMSDDEFATTMNAYARVAAFASGEKGAPVPPLFAYKALAVYRAVRWQFAKAPAAAAA